MDNIILVIITYVVIAILLICIVLNLIKRKKQNRLKWELEELDREKNEIGGAPVLVELSKLETIVKNDKMEEKYREWFNEFEIIKTNTIPKINDMIIDLDIFLDKKDYKSYTLEYAKVEIEIYKARTATNNLLEEIKEVNLSEEKYRKIITKLKVKYRELSAEFESTRANYEEIEDVIDLQFENIEKRFQDFEDSMEKNDYHEVYHIVKAIDVMIDHMDIVIKEVPDLVLLAKRLIPKRIEQITEIYDDMLNKEYPLEYLKIEYNVEESLKNVNKIIDRIKVLNLEDCMFELKTMLEYLDSLFNEFETEKIAKKNYEESKTIFDERLTKTNKVVADIYCQLDDIKSMYDLTDKDVLVIDDVNKKLDLLNKNYKLITKAISKKKMAYSESYNEMVKFTNDLKQIENELDVSLKSLGNMYEDEERAREQLDEIQEFLKQSKVKMRSYKLPIISNNYFVELAEANEAIGEVVKELEKKPITIKVLNTRVDTARDLVLKLYNTTNEMIKKARLAEFSIVYGNRYRAENINIESGLTQAQMFFYKGNYDKALEIAVNTIERVDPKIRKQVFGK